MTFRLRHWLGRGRADPAQPKAGRPLARKLVERGIAAEQSGRAVDALQHYREAVAADPDFAPAHMNLGIALQATGDLTAATASYERAIAADADYDAAHFNLALALLHGGRYEQAEASFRRALRIREDFPEAWVGLAGALEMLGRDEEALAALEKAIALREDYVGALRNASALLSRLQRHEAAAASDRRVLAVEPEDHVAQCRLGRSLQALGRTAEAEARYREALRLRPDHAEATTSLASLLKDAGRVTEGIALLFAAVAAAADHTPLRASLVDALHGIGLKSVTDVERQVLLDLSRDDAVSLVFLATTIVTLMKHDAGFALAQACMRRGVDPFAGDDPAVAKFLRDPLLHSALPRMTIPDAEAEAVLTHMRRWILRRFAAAQGATPADPVVPPEFVCMLARQCAFSGYAFFRDEEEIGRVAGVRAAVESALTGAVSASRELERALAVVALYEPLHALEGASRLLAVPTSGWSDAFRPLLQEHLENRVRERRIAAELSAITPIDDAISRAVRTQYEENPYPRWATVPTPPADTIEDLARRLRPDRVPRVRSRPAQVLVAGCGTGHHSIQVARTYPDSHVLAVDLSRASLAYAVRMTERFGIANVSYRQADILKLGELEQRFALIECCGVLHHMHDPLAGWQVLVGLLDQDGLMRIALYSEAARRGIEAARVFVRTLDLPPTQDGIRQCRQALLALPDGHPARDVVFFRDFYTLDECRDLVLHVQEHVFTLPRIAECLDRLGLRFLQFECAEATMARFRQSFPAADAGADLAAWHRFETAHPDTFKAMYTFWCCRK